MKTGKFKDRAKFRLASDFYSQVILIGEEDGEAWVYWDTKNLNEAEALLRAALTHIQREKDKVKK
jgi:hypothetical protein